MRIIYSNGCVRKLGGVEFSSRSKKLSACGNGRVELLFRLPVYACLKFNELGQSSWEVNRNETLLYKNIKQFIVSLILLLP